MPKTSNLTYVQDFAVTHKLRVNGVELSEKMSTKRFLKLKDPKGKAKELLYEENVHLRTIDGRSVEMTEKIQDGNRTETTQCHGMEEKDLGKFEEEWSALWNPRATQKEIDAATQDALD